MASSSNIKNPATAHDRIPSLSFQHYRDTNNISHDQQHDYSTSNTTTPATATAPSHSYADAYSHPEALAYVAAHPGRTIPRLGPYIVLQRLGKGKGNKFRRLGLHIQAQVAVAVKLTRMRDLDVAKLEREIEIMKFLKHPNIIHLFDVIETTKYVAIILDYASGGELLDFILSHKPLDEGTTGKLFSQLLSGVWYLHQKKIVHRNLNLETVLLNRHGDIVISGFGSATRFDGESSKSAMKMRCGSPYFAAPEVILSEGPYMAQPLDVWSCGVILYTMLVGHLPFNEDLTIPSGNDELLYGHIVSVPLIFSPNISRDVQTSISMMLIPDPTRRAGLDDVMGHPWLVPFSIGGRVDGIPSAFGKSVDDLEREARDEIAWRRLRSVQAEQLARAMKQRTVQIQRTQSTPQLLAAQETAHFPSHRVDDVTPQPDAVREVAEESPVPLAPEWDTLSAKTSVYSLASSRTASTDYGIYCRRMALSQESLQSWDGLSDS